MFLGSASANAFRKHGGEIDPLSNNNFLLIPKFRDPDRYVEGKTTAVK
jgi:hypothetical protein